MRIEPLSQNSKFFNAEPRTVRFKYHNPFTNSEVTRKISLTFGDQVKVVFATLLGICLGVVGAPFLFFYTSKKLRERQIQEIKDLDPKDGKVNQEALQRIFGKDFANSTLLEKNLQPSRLPLDWSAINNKCEQVKIYAQVSLDAKEINRFTETIVIRSEYDTPIEVEEMQAALTNKLKALRHKIAASGTTLNDQLQIKSVALLKMPNGKWGYAQGNCHVFKCLQRSGNGFGFNMGQAATKFKQLLDELELPVQHIVDRNLNFID